MSKKERLSEERRQLVGFVKTTFRFMLQGQSSNADATIAIALDFQRIEWNQAPLSEIRMAAADAVEWCQDVTGDQLARLDGELASEGLPTLTAMRHTKYRQALRVLARNKIRNESEWHLLNGFIADTADRTLSPQEREHAGRLLDTYPRNKH